MGNCQREFFAAQSIWTVMGVHADRRRKAAEFMPPVSDNRRRADEQGGHIDLMLFSFVNPQRDRLGRFPQTHIVGEARAEAHSPHLRQPAKSAHLIWS